MALVRISHELRQDVRYSINQIYDPKIDAAKKSHGNWGKPVYDLMMEPHRKNLEQVRADFINTTDRISIRGIQGVIILPFTIVSSLPATSPWPRSSPKSVFPLIYQQDYNGIVLVDDPVLGTIRQEMLDFVKRIDDATTEKQVVLETLDALLSAHTTLASALQAWPALWELLPKETKERHAAPSTKTKAVFAQTPDLSTLDNLAADFARKKLLDAMEKK